MTDILAIAIVLVVIYIAIVLVVIYAAGRLLVWIGHRDKTELRDPERTITPSDWSRR